ncbi:MAG: hypothetical protein ACI8W8_001816 [Rhodothermales bacterium]|jgi:hypothetical protein
MKRLVFVFLLLAGSVQAEWFVLRWIEKPAKNGPSKQVERKDRAHFLHRASYNHLKQGAADFMARKSELREGDIIAYKLDKADARRKIFLEGKLNIIGYRLLKYGHLGIVVKDPEDPTKLRLFSSHSFVGPNVKEGLDTLITHSWDCYRLDKWDRVDKPRLYDFVAKSRERAEAWYGYDFSGMFGLWNSNLKPQKPSKIGHDYICSTVVVAALYYSGLELDAIQRGGILDLVTPKQVVSSDGRFIPLPEVEFSVETQVATAAPIVKAKAP